jgi:hypothetical protein
MTRPTFAAMLHFCWHVCCLIYSVHNVYTLFGAKSQTTDSPGHTSTSTIMYPLASRVTLIRILVLFLHKYQAKNVQKQHKCWRACVVVDLAARYAIEMLWQTLCLHVEWCRWRHQETTNRNSEQVLIGRWLGKPLDDQTFIDWGFTTVCYEWNL